MAFTDVFLGAFIAMMATSIGACGVFFFRKIDKNAFSILLAFSAGVMAFSTVEMIVQAHKTAGDFTVAAGALLGLFALLVVEKTLPHVHMLLRKKTITVAKKKAALIAGTISIHNIPEGFAIASAFAGSLPLGWMVTASMALQDAPEGFLVSAPLAGYGVDLKRSLKFGILSGVVEFVSAVIGFLFLSAVASIIPFALAFSAGAMAFVILAELLPDAFLKGHRRASAVAFILGVAIAFGLATLFGF
ncbi:MAG: ZIP family metal transporter [Candidatus Micrarchaeota archaeon]